MASSGKKVTIGVRTPAISPRSIAMPTSAEITLLDADLTLAGRAAVARL